MPLTVTLWQFYLLLILKLRHLLVFEKSDLYFMIFIIPFLYYKYTYLGLFIFDYFKIYFVFFLFYLIFKNVKINFNTISKILIVIHVIEIIAITFNVEPLGLFNFQDVNTGITLFGADLRRPVGIFTNSAMSASAYVVILTLTTDKYVRLLMGLTIVTFFSGTGLIALFIYLIYKNFNLTKLFVGLLLFTLFSKSNILNKISDTQIILLLESKINILLDHINKMEINELLFGSNEIQKLSDFGFSLFLSSYGVYGIIVIVAFFGSKMNKENYLSILMTLILSVIHYPFTALAFGALLLGIILSRKKENVAISYNRIYHHNIQSVSQSIQQDLGK
jgi:hypothetical protein